MSRTFVVDLGSWSVKLALAVPGLRGGTVTHVVERPLPPGEAPAAARAQAVLEDLVKELKLGPDAMYLAVRGDQLFTQVLELPFRNLRRSELEKAVGGELEGVVPVDLEDMVFAFDPILGEPQGPPVDSGAGPVHGKSAAPTTGMRVLTYSLRRDRAEAMLEAGKRLGIEPRGLLPAAGGAARLVTSAGLGAELGASTVAVIDLGHERTEVVLVRSGHAVFSRSLARGGKQLTEAISRTWKLPMFDAERVKHNDGFVASSMEPPVTEEASRLHGVLAMELAALVRDLRQTFLGARARVGVEPIAVVLVGGGARLRGISSFLSEKLGIQVRTLAESELLALVGPKLADRSAVDSAAATVGLLHDALSGRPFFNLRQGSLAVKVDLSFLRAKLWAVGAAAVAVSSFAAVSAYANMYRLRKAEKVLQTRLADESQQHFGGKKTADEVLATPGAAGGNVESPMPKITAYDLLLDISAQVPGKDKITLDLFRIDINGTKVDLEGTAKKAEEIDLFQGELKKKITCFEDVSRGTTESDANGLQRFKINIKSNCM
ncbi:MAG: pilus assembly protein PilM [Myxococcales bacterium]|nr:pilus assembly protein PilM [Myxococcales bacterium]